MKQKDKTTKCQSSGRHEYVNVGENDYYLVSRCRCGDMIREKKGLDGRLEK